MAPRPVDPDKIVTCPKCAVSGPARDLLYFYKSGPKVGRPISLACRACRPHRKPLADPTIMLTCPKCGASGPACDLFYFHKSGPKKGSITQAHCRACEYERVKEHKERRPIYGPPVPMGARIRSKPQQLLSTRTVNVEVDGVVCRPCTACGETLPLERFTPKKGKNDRVYYSSQCKACRSAHETAKYHAGEREVPLEVQRERARLWRVKNPERSRMAVRRRRARRRDAEGMYTEREWLEMLAAWDHCCAYCGKHDPGKLHADHVVSIKRGGSDLIENIAPACQRCNLSKGARTGMEFVHGTDRPLAEAVA